jgi:hypothetical protein
MAGSVAPHRRVGQSMGLAGCQPPSSLHEQILGVVGCLPT